MGLLGCFWFCVVKVDECLGEVVFDLMVLFILVFFLLMIWGVWDCIVDGRILYLDMLVLIFFGVCIFWIGFLFNCKGFIDWDEKLFIRGLEFILIFDW